MARPRAFVSSTYLDLRDVRDSVAEFFRSAGFDPVLFERGGVYFDPSLPVDHACLDEVEKADLFVLIIGARYGSPSTTNAGTKRGNYNSVTKAEYEKARNNGVPVITFVRREVDVEFRTYMNNPAVGRDKLTYSHVDDVQVFKLLEQIYQLRRGNPVIPFNSSTDLVRSLRDQLTGMLGDALKKKRATPQADIPVHLNAYKLFFFRTQRGFSFTDLQTRTSIPRDRLRQLEKIAPPSKAKLDLKIFPKATEHEIEVLEEVLACKNLLRAGREDDFLGRYIHYFATYKGRAPAKPRAGAVEMNLWPFRAVVFDFDGTLTFRGEDLTTWEHIWVDLGYSVNECAYYHRQFSEGIITHKEWCKITLQKFREKGLTKGRLDEIANRIHLLDDTAEVLRELHRRGISLYIVSGSIERVIRNVLGELYDLFDGVQANDLTFGPDGQIRAIRGTAYDFEGKARYIRELIDSTELTPLEILFVGNSCNDIYASRSGVRTLCVNPHFTDPNVLEHWTYCLRSIKSLKEVLWVIDGAVDNYTYASRT